MGPFRTCKSLKCDSQAASEDLFKSPIDLGGPRIRSSQMTWLRNSVYSQSLFRRLLSRIFTHMISLPIRHNKQIVRIVIHLPVMLWANFRKGYDFLITKFTQIFQPRVIKERKSVWDRKILGIYKTGIDPSLDHDDDDVIKWKHFPGYWPFVRGIHRSPVDSPVTGEFPVQRPVTRSFDIVFDLRLNKRLSKQS